MATMELVAVEKAVEGGIVVPGAVVVVPSTAIVRLARRASLLYANMLALNFVLPTLSAEILKRRFTKDGVETRALLN